MKHIWMKDKDTAFTGEPVRDRSRRPVWKWVYRCSQCGAEITHDATKIQRKDWEEKFKECDVELARRTLES